jgi:hypothetical protein
LAAALQLLVRVQQRGLTVALQLLVRAGQRGLAVALQLLVRARQRGLAVALPLLVKVEQQGLTVALQSLVTAQQQGLAVALQLQVMQTVELPEVLLRAQQGLAQGPALLVKVMAVLVGLQGLVSHKLHQGLPGPLERGWVQLA